MDRKGRAAFRGWRVALTVLSLLTVGLPLVYADLDQLAEADHDALIHHLNIIANDPGWPQESVNAANAILADAQYTAVAWNTFFTEYFTDYPFTDPLFNYLGYPVFYWFGDAIHTRLQEGLYGPLLLVNVNPDWVIAAAGADDIFTTDAILRHDLHNSERFLAMIGIDDSISPLLKLEIYDHILNLIDQYPGLLRKTVSFDRAAQPYFAMLRAQTYATLLAAAPGLDFSIKNQIAETLGLTGHFAEIWIDFTCLLLENNLTDDQQRQYVYNCLNLVPQQLHNLRSITVNELLGNNSTYQDGTYDIRRPYGGVNIFGCPIGYYHENSFPPDVTPGLVDGFSIVVVHELNHVVDAYGISADAELEARKNALIAAAGNDHMNYLRSMFEDGFFVQNPQEFFASISNQWFADSAKTIELGLVRFDVGRPDPINQALFFAEVYSVGNYTTLFYTLDTAGNLAREIVALERDENGHINELIIAGQRYSFELDDDGDVTAYLIEPLNPCDLDGDGDVDLADLATLLAAYSACEGDPDYNADADFDASGCVDLADLAELLGNYGVEA